MKGKMLLKVFGFLSVACILFGCNPSNTQEKKSLLSPPAWIQGSWEDDYSTACYTFSEDNIISVINMEGMDATFDFLRDYKIEEEEKSEGKYSVTYSALSQTVRMEFTQTNETALMMVGYYNGSTEGGSGIKLTKK